MSTQSLIINSPYDVQTAYWERDNKKLNVLQGRRPAAYDIF